MIGLDTAPQLATQISSGIIENYKSYWATHFYSFLQCLHNQKNINYRPSMLSSFPIWTLSTLRGTMEINFFNSIRRNVQNHGFQYFLTNFLNLKMSSGIVSQLIHNLSKIHQVSFNPEYNNYMFYMAGWDSTLGDGIAERFELIFPHGTEGEVKDVIDRSDICMVLTDPTTNGKIGIFGEVEGNHGNRQLLGSYWSSRPKLSSFSIGISKSSGNGCWFQQTQHNDIDRVHIQFYSGHFVVMDFVNVLDFYQDIFLKGPFGKFQHIDEEFDFFANLIAANWNTPMDQLLGALYSYVNGNDIIFKPDGSLASIQS